MASSSTATHDQTELENAFEQPAPDSTSTSAEPRQNLNCVTEIIKLLQDWCRSIQNDLERICTVPFLRFFWASKVSQQTPPDPQNAFDQLAPFRASTSTEPCQIFINHRGSDVKYTLASKIYQTLDGMGFRAFLDVEALEPGDVIPAEIQAAMTSASLHIAIFSPNYAQSPWCLAELSFMLKTGAKIIPIFYLVKPDDLRWIEQGKGIYAHAFSEHRKKGRYTQEKLDEWQTALHDISFHSGWSINNNEDESRVLKNVVYYALKVMKNVPLWVDEHPLGLDELVQALESVASEGNLKITGIVGMGGSGKTTLAKELFNRNFSSFEKCSFVSDVRDAAFRNALPDKQKKLLGDLGVDHLPFDNVDEGKTILSNRLSSLRALIVLDDVDHIDQVNALLPNKHNLGSQSMVVITTRELNVLISWGVSTSCIYKMPRFNNLHAEQLFCWHAFLQPSPPARFVALVQKFIEACDGLPLSLKVLGGQLYGRDSRDYWESLLNKISRILPGDIKERLQVSYNALDEEEKEMFLDVACFLIGERKSTAIAVWDGMQLSGLHGFETLVNKCLVEVVREWHYFYDRPELSYKIRMHDHLRDMGREIASGRSPYRLWCPEQIDNIKKHFKKRMLFRGIRPAEAFVALKEYTYQLMGNSSRRSKRLGLSNGLQILSVQGNDFTEEFASLSEDLVWLRWEGFPLRNIPSWLTLRHLSVLELYCYHELKELWDDNADPPLQLRKLIIGDCCSLERLPSSIGRLQCLKKLRIVFHGSSLPKEFYGLQSLESLKLKAPGLSTLSAGFGNLISLRNIKLTCCKLSTLPDSFSQLIHLEKLDLLYCEMLSSLPVGFGNLISLKRLSMFSYKQLSTLPDSLSQLIHLESLSLLCCEMLSSLPVGFGNLISLKHIELKSCKQLSTLPDSFKQLIHLEDLNLSSCAKLKLKLDMLENIRKLKVLQLADCEQLEDLPHQIMNQESLTVLDLEGCIKLRGSPANIGELVKLQSLEIENLMLESLQTSLVNFSSLKKIKIVSTSYAGDEDCKQVSRLSISNDHFPILETFEVRGNRHLTEIETLPASLKELSIGYCKVLKSIRCISSLVRLEKLKISDYPQVEEFSSSAGLASLKKFSMENCPKVEQIEGLQHSKSLKKLSLRGTCWKVPGIQSLEKVERLEELVLECDTISALKPCIQSTKAKECPRRMEIKGSVSRFVKPIVNSLEFPDLTVREVEKLNDARKILASFNSSAFSFNSPAFLCYVEGKEENDEESDVESDEEGKEENDEERDVDESDEESDVEGKEENDEERDVGESDEESDVEGKEENDEESDEERKVVSICVSLDDNIANNFLFNFLFNGGRMGVDRAKVKAMVVAGEKGRVWEAFHQLLTLLE